MSISGEIIPDTKITGIATKLWDVMGDLGYLTNDKKHPQGWGYASEAAHKEAVQKALIKHRVLFFPTSSTVVDIREGVVIVRLMYEFIDIDSGQRLAGSFDGTGSSRDDKGTYKADTGALKYALRSTFLIPTGDDPENEDKPRKTEEDSPAARKQDAKIAAQEAQLVAQRKIDELKKQEQKPKLEVPPAFQKILDNVGTSKDLILAKLSDLAMELLDSYDGNVSKYQTLENGLISRYGGLQFADMPVNDLRRVLYHVWKEIELGNKREPQENPVLQKVVAEMPPVNVSSDAPPFWTEQPMEARKASPEYAAAEARKQAGTSYDENTKGKRGKR